jgi:hypothetical protein
MPERNLDAEDRYRKAWLEHHELGRLSRAADRSFDQLAADTERCKTLERLMDSLQPAIANNPKDQRWVDFVKTLPGFDYFHHLKLRPEDVIQPVPRLRRRQPLPGESAS